MTTEQAQEKDDTFFEEVIEGDTETAVVEPETEQTAQVEKPTDPFSTGTIVLTMRYLPDDGNPAGREVMIAVFREGEYGFMETCRENQLGKLPEILDENLTKLKARLNLRATPAATATKPKTSDVTINPVKPVAPAASKAKPAPAKTATGQASFFDL